MNEQLKPIFEKIIPAIKAGSIKYWIYGGIANAAVFGSCYRSNPDVDLFVLEEDFDKTEEVLVKLCNDNGWKVSKTFLNNRPKIEVLILKNLEKWIERLSVVPVYLIGNNAELKFKEGQRRYSGDILQQTERRLNNFTFYTISNEFLKKLFIEYLDSKEKYPPKRIDDARKILTDEEFKKYFPSENYDQNI